MEFKGNKEALRVLKKSRGTDSISELFALAELKEESYIVFADAHVRGSAAAKGVQFKYVNDTDGVVLHVQAGDNGTRVAVKIKRKGRGYFDYETFAAKVRLAISKLDARPKPETAPLDVEAEPAPPRSEAKPQPTDPRGRRYAKPNEHAIGLVLIELLDRAPDGRGALSREEVVEAVKRVLSVEASGTGPFIRSMTTRELGILEKKGANFVFDADRARLYVKAVTIVDPDIRYPFPDDARFPTLLPLDEEKLARQLSGRTLSALRDDRVMDEAGRLRGDIAEIAATYEARLAHHAQLVLTRKALVERIGRLDQLLRLKAEEGASDVKRHEALVDEFWALFLPDPSA